MKVKTDFETKARGKFRGALKNPKLIKVSEAIEAGERIVNIPKTLLGLLMVFVGVALIYFKIPFGSEVLQLGIGSVVVGLGFKFNRKLLGKSSMNQIEQALLKLFKKG